MIRKYTPQEKLALKSCLQEISNSKTRMEAERDNIKAIIDRMADEYEMPKVISRKLGTIYHKANLAEENAKHEEITEAYDAIVN